MQTSFQIKNNRTGYWAAAGAISFFMLFSAYYAAANAVEFKQLGFPNYFRIELVIAKLIGAPLLLIPQVSDRMKEWIYAGFVINLISALIAKFNNDYTLLQSLEPLAVLIMTVLLIRYLDKLKKAKGSTKMQ